MSSIISNPQTQCVKKKKRSNRNIPNIQKIIILFFKLSVYFNSCEETEIIKGDKGPPLHIHCSILSF